MRSLLLQLLVLAILASPTLAQDAGTSTPGQGDEPVQLGTADHEVADIPSVHAKEDCSNWSWAATVEAVLRSDGVSEYPQDYWMDKVYGGTICLDSAGDTEKLTKAIEGEYVLDDGKHVRMTADYTHGLPVNASDLLVPLIHDRLQIAFLNGKAMLFTGARWEDVAKPRGDRNTLVKELRFQDLTQPAGKQNIVLDPERDDLSQVNGIFRIYVAVIPNR